MNTKQTVVVATKEELVNIIKNSPIDADLNYLDVSNITDMSSLFAHSKFNGDISKWDVSNVTDMSSMFEYSNFNGDISKWNVSSVTDMFNMFNNSKFNGDISKWDVSSVIYMSNMFQHSKFNGDISYWNVSNVTNMEYMFYNNTIFHRVIKGFMIQGGDPNGDGTGGPGYKFKDEPIVGDYQRGTVAMANSGPDTNGSQFFIIHQDYDLPKNYVIFGQVIQGMEVVDKIAVAQVGPSSGGENSKPLNPVVIKSVEILEE